MATARLPSPPPIAEDQIGPKSPLQMAYQPSPVDSSVPTHPLRRIRPGTKAVDMAEGPPMMALNEIDSAFQHAEYLKAKYYDLTHPAGSGRVIPLDEEAAQELVIPPQGSNRHVWLYELCRFLCQKTNVLILALFNSVPPCTGKTCSEMRASEWQYLCAVHNPPRTCSAMDYSCHTLDWAVNTLTSPTNFPSRMEIDSEMSLMTILRRVYRIFAHTWFQHNNTFWQVESSTGIYTLFYTTCVVYNLVPEQHYTIPRNFANPTESSSAQTGGSMPLKRNGPIDPTIHSISASIRIATGSKTTHDDADGHLSNFGAISTSLADAFPPLPPLNQSDDHEPPTPEAAHWAEASSTSKDSFIFSPSARKFMESQSDRLGQSESRSKGWRNQVGPDRLDRTVSPSLSVASVATAMHDSPGATDPFPSLNGDLNRFLMVDPLSQSADRHPSDNSAIQTPLTASLIPSHSESGLARPVDGSKEETLDSVVFPIPPIASSGLADDSSSSGDSGPSTHPHAPLSISTVISPILSPAESGRARNHDWSRRSGLSRDSDREPRSAKSQKPKLQPYSPDTPPSSVGVETPIEGRCLPVPSSPVDIVSDSPTESPAVESESDGRETDKSEFDRMVAELNSRKPADEKDGSASKAETVNNNEKAEEKCEADTSVSEPDPTTVNHQSDVSTDSTDENKDEDGDVTKPSVVELSPKLAFPALDVSDASIGDDNDSGEIQGSLVLSSPILVSADSESSEQEDINQDAVERVESKDQDMESEEPTVPALDSTSQPDSSSTPGPDDESDQVSLESSQEMDIKPPSTSDKKASTRRKKKRK